MQYAAQLKACGDRRTSLSGRSRRFRRSRPSITGRSRPGFLNDVAHRNGMMPPGSRASLADGFVTGDDVWSSLSGLPFLGSTQALAGKFYPVSVVDETVEDGVGVGGVPDQRRIPHLSMDCVRSGGLSLGGGACAGLFRLWEPAPRNGANDGAIDRRRRGLKMSHVETQLSLANDEDAGLKAFEIFSPWPAVVIGIGAIATLLWIGLLGWLLARAAEVWL
jgi:hypothetical protein